MALSRWNGPLALMLIAGLLSACGKSPSGPTPPPPPPSPPVITAPVITAVNVATTRTEVDREIEITAVVEDAEKAPETLLYIWSATAGTFNGAGRTVSWRLPKGEVQTPVDVVISVTVVEPYQAVENNVIVNREHRITREATPLRVHDSAAEISRMAVHFLVDLFGDSSKSPDQCLVDFWPACPGTEAERKDIIENRQYRRITSVDATVKGVSFNGPRTGADVTASCTFRDIELSSGKPDETSGDCVFEAVYHDARWWLCSSRFFEGGSSVSRTTRTSRPISAYWRGAGEVGVK
jgi:hypothetical protein